MKPRFVGVLAVIGLVLTGGSSALAQTLGTAESFAVLGGSTVTNTGPSSILGNLGVSPGTAVTGFPPGIVVGTIHAADAVALQAQSDVTIAYNTLAGLPCGTNLTGSDLGGMVLLPGTYCFNTSAQLTGTLTLNAQNNPNAVFVFQIGSTLTTASSSIVNLINGAQNCSVRIFWQVGSSATLGTGTQFAGNIVALASVTLTTGANLSGRALARNGAVTLDTSSVSVCHGAPACPAITVSPTTLPGGVVGTPYIQTVSAAGSTALPYTFTISSGSLPTGLSLNGTSGAITGTPTTVGLFTFTVTATDTNGCSGFQGYSVQIAPAACPLITLSPSTLPNGVVGTPYLQTVTASPAGAYTYSVSTGALPNGLSLNPVTGAITGTPTTAALFGFTITATAANGCAGSQAYSVRILPAACPLVTLSPSTLPNGTVGTAYNQTVSASPPGIYTFQVTVGLLPNGLSLNPATGAITGTPTTVGPFDFTITATNGSGCTGSLAYSIRILPAGCPIITVSTAALPNGVVGTAYNQTITVLQPGPYTFSVPNGPLPLGLSINPSTGVITGIPTTVGSFSFTIAATNASGCIGTQAYTVTIAPAATIPTLSEWGMMILAALLALYGASVMRRQTMC